MTLIGKIDQKNEGMGQKFYRNASYVRAVTEGAERMVDVAFSSEEPGQRWFGTEILDHAPESVRMDWLNSGNAPVALDHDTCFDNVIGTVVSATVDGDRRARARIKIATGGKADEAWARLQDGRLNNVSVGYIIHKTVTEEKAGSGDMTVRVTDWEPLEISFVSVPMDRTVGVGRSAPELKNNVIVKRGENQMEIEAMKKAAVEQALGARNKEVARIQQIGLKFGLENEAAAFIRDAKGADEFLDYALTRGGPAGPVARRAESPFIGISDKEAKKFSFVRAIRALDSGNWAEAGFEREVSEATQKRFSEKAFSGIAVPMDVLIAKRDQQVNNPTTGGYLVQSGQDGSFIELLRSKIWLLGLGARFMSGLVGNLEVPKMTGGSTSYWVTEGGAVTESVASFGQVAMRPRTVGNYVDITRRLLLQSSVDVESMIRDDFAKGMAVAIERAGFQGSGAAGEPLGILNTTGVGAQNIGSTPTFSGYVSMETSVATGEALSGNLAYILTNALAGSAKTTLKSAGVAGYIMENKEINGYPAYRSSLLPTGKALFGNFEDIIIGQWGALDIFADRSANVTSGGLRMVALQDIDIAVRHPESFCVGTAA